MYNYMYYHYYNWKMKSEQILNHNIILFNICILYSNYFDNLF